MNEKLKEEYAYRIDGIHEIDGVSFDSLSDKQKWILNVIIDSLNYIGKETNLSNTENELRKLSIKQINDVIKSL